MTLDMKASDQLAYDQIFEEKFKAFLFPEPYFSDYLREIEDKVRPLAPNWTQDEIGKYTRYLKVVNREVSSLSSQKHAARFKQNHSQKLSKFLREVFKSNLKFYHDFELHIENEVFYCHRLLVACFIPFLFHKLSQTKAKFYEAKKLRLKGISAKAFKIILQYIYNGYCEPNEEYFIPVLDAAIRFFMYEFADTWIEMYEEKFSTRSEQLLFRCKMARKYKWGSYISRLNRVLALDLENLIISDKFFSLTFYELKDLIMEDELGVQSEVIVFLAVLKWLKYNWEARNKYTVDLMSQVRFSLMTRQELFACFVPPILKEAVDIPQVKDMITASINYHLEIEQGKNKKLPSVGAHKKRIYRATSPTWLQLWSPSDATDKDIYFKSKTVTPKIEDSKVGPIVSTPVKQLPEPEPAVMSAVYSTHSSPMFKSQPPMSQTQSEDAAAEQSFKVKSEVKEPTHKAFYKQAEKLRRTFLAEETEHDLLELEPKTIGVSSKKIASDKEVKKEATDKQGKREIKTNLTESKYKPSEAEQTEETIMKAPDKDEKDRCTCERADCEKCKARKKDEDKLGLKEDLLKSRSKGRHKPRISERRVTVDELTTRERDQIKDRSKDRNKDAKGERRRHKEHDKKDTSGRVRPPSKRRDSQKFKTTDLQKLSQSRSRSSSGSLSSNESPNIKKVTTSAKGKKPSKLWRIWF